MADDNSESQYGPYMDQDLQYASLIKNVINPSVAGPAGPTPAAPAPTPAPAVATPATPAVAPPAPSPAAVTRTGDPSTQSPKTWADMYRQQQQAKLGQDQGELTRLQQNGAGVNQIRNPFLRGIAKVGDVAASTLTPGLAANLPGTTAHNRQLQGQAEGRVKQDQATLQSGAQLADTESQTQEREAQAGRQAAQAQSYTPITLSPQDAAAVGHPELAGEQMSQRAYAQMISGKARTDAATTGANARTQSAQTAADARTGSAQIAADARTGAAQISADAKKFGHAQKATKGPNEELRQPMIDAATAQVNKLNTYKYDEDANDGAGGFYDPTNPAKVYSPEEFTALKNTIATKLDKDLATKRLRPLGVRFNVNDTTPGKGAQPAQAPAQSAQKTAAEPTPPAGATHQYRDKSGKIVGYAVNGKYVPVGAK